MAGIADSRTGAADGLPGVEGAGRTGGPPREKASRQRSRQSPLTGLCLAAIGAVVWNKVFVSQKLNYGRHRCGGVYQVF